MRPAAIGTECVRMPQRPAMHPTATFGKTFLSVMDSERLATLWVLNRSSGVCRRPTASCETGVIPNAGDRIL